jgi:type IX secretion system substrate protein
MAVRLAILYFIAFLSQGILAQNNQIKGSVFLDRNSTGVLDSGDVLQPAVRVYLYEDLNANGVLDATDNLIDSIFTDAGGSFDFSVAGNTFSKRISNNSDDAEERISNGNVTRGSTDLELGFDGPNQQIVGMRFRNVTIPQGITITNAYIEFECDEADNGTTNINFYGQDVNNAAGFTTTAYSISTRTKTTANVNWNNIPAWTVNGKYQTPDLSPIIQEIVNRPGWSSGNKLVIMADGTGERTAESRNGEAAAAPLLVVDYSNGVMDYIVRVNTDDYSTGHTATTDTTFAVNFTGYGQIDSNNTFGFYGSSVGCYVADDASNRLWMINRFSGYHEEIGNMGVPDVEAIAADIAGLNLYATDAGQLGTLNRYTGVFTAYPNPVGSGDGVDGVINFNDIDGLVFDPFQDVLLGTVRRNSDYDVLIQIDTGTGQYIPDAFGPGIDYVEVTGTGFLLDIDDLAINPVSGQIYGINNNGGTNDYLVTIDKTNGNGNIVSLIGVDDVEGLGITNDGLFYATTGNQSGTNSDKFYQIDEITGVPTLIKAFSGGGDFEACDCLLGHINALILSLEDIYLDVETYGENDVEISFQNASDDTGYIYFIERSDRNLNFIVIREIKSDGEGSYSLIDNNPFMGLNLYRIKMLNPDGHFDYSNISGVTFMDSGENLLVYPNPNDGNNISFIISGKVDNLVSIEVIDAYGNIIYKTNRKTNRKKDFNLKFPSTLLPGMYIVNLSNENIISQQKFIVK